MSNQKGEVNTGGAQIQAEDLRWIDPSLGVRGGVTGSVEATLNPFFRGDGSLDWCMPEASRVARKHGIAKNSPN